MKTLHCALMFLTLSGLSIAEPSDLSRNNSITVPLGIYYSSFTLMSIAGLGTKIAYYNTREDGLKYPSAALLNTGLMSTAVMHHFFSDCGDCALHNLGSILYVMGIISEYGISHTQSDNDYLSWALDKHVFVAVMFYLFSVASYERNLFDYKKEIAHNVSIGPAPSGGAAMIYSYRF